MSSPDHKRAAKRIAEMVWMLALQGESDALEALTVEVEGYLTRAIPPRGYPRLRHEPHPIEPTSLQASVSISPVDSRGVTFVSLWARNKVLGLNDIHCDLPTLHGTLGRAVLLACADVPFTQENLHPTDNRECPESSD